MTASRTSSSKRKIQSVRTESEKNPNGFPNGSRDGYGMGTGVGGSSSRLAAQDRSAAYFDRLASWCRNNLPDEHEPLVAGAFAHLHYQRKREPSKQDVLDHLKATGRDRKTWDEAH